MEKLNKWKKILLALKVFLPIIIKGIIDTWKEILDAYDENNMQALAYIAEEVENLAKKE